MQELTEAQKDYFSGSKIRDGTGELQKFYHGTTHNFDAFAKNSREGNMSDLEAGFFFTSYKREADSYGINRGGQTLEVYLNITKPLVLESKEDYVLMNKYMAECFPGVNWQQEHMCSVKFQNYLQSKGYDGIVTDSMVVAYKPNQIKSVDNLYPTKSDNFRDNSQEYLKENIGRLSITEQCAISKHIQKTQNKESKSIGGKEYEK